MVAGIPSASDYQATPYEVINLGNNQTVSLNEMIAGLQRSLNVRAARTRMPEQPGDVPQTWANIEKARTLLGYEPKISYEEGVGRFAHWLTLNRSTPLVT